MSPREMFMQRVKQAVAEGNRAGAALPLPERGHVGYQGGGPDPVQRFCQELAAAGGVSHIAPDAEGAVRSIQSILQAHNARKILLTCGGLIDRLELPARLRAMGLEVVGQPFQADEPASSSSVRLESLTYQDFFAADVGITNVYRLIAETGTVVVASEPNEPRSASLLPPVHIALADRSQLLPDLFDLFDLFSPNVTKNQSLPPSCLSLITGPSKTGDIELKLVTGVHGPGEIHVIVCGG
jgi:L-lactate dehydrogenase complex protein LldG